MSDQQSPVDSVGPLTEASIPDAVEGDTTDAETPDAETPDAETVGPESTDGKATGSTITDAAKLIRLGTMTQSLMSEAREAPLDEAGRTLLAKIHTETMAALQDTISQDLLDELQEFQLCMDGTDEPPSESELRIAQAQLVGWLQGLHQGFQAMAMAQQAAAMQQLQQLQAGPPHGGGETIEASSRPGTYL